jgi:hypothetical protein
MVDNYSLTSSNNVFFLVLGISCKKAKILMI